MQATTLNSVTNSSTEAVLLGSAVLGTVAGGRYPSVLAAMNAMNPVQRVIAPATGRARSYHDRKYRVFHQMHHDFLHYRQIMSDPKPSK